MSGFSLIHRRPWVALLLLFVAMAALLLPGLESTVASRQQELRVLLCAREMAEGGDWVIPHFMGEERLRKPPLMYWLVAGAFHLVGSTESLGAARAVSVLCALALVISTYLFGRGIVGRQSAFFGALVLATSLGFLYHGRLAETDVPQTLFCSLSVMFLYEAVVSGRFRGWVFAGLASGLGFMIKGPASVAMPLAAVFSYFLLTRFKFPQQVAIESGRVKPVSYFLWGALTTTLLTALLTAPWYYAVALRTVATGDQASDEISRLLTESAHRGSIFFYFYILPARMGVWGLALPVAVYAAWKQLRHHRGVRWLLCWLASSFTILSLLSSKQNHYALLLFVPAALLVGRLLNQSLSYSRSKTSGLSPVLSRRVSSVYGRFASGYLTLLLGLAALVGLAGLVAWAAQIQMIWPWPVVVVCAFILVLSVALLRAIKKSFSPHLCVLALVLMIALAGGVYQLSLEKVLEGDSVVEALIQDHRLEIKRSPLIAVSGDHPAMVAWYAHQRVEEVPSLKAGGFSKLRQGEVLISSARKKRLELNPMDPPPTDKRALKDVEAVLYVR